jgi:IS5 family transposase
VDGFEDAGGNGDFFDQPLREQINLKHLLVHLADLISWDRLGTAVSCWLFA